MLKILKRLVLILVYLCIGWFGLLGFFRLGFMFRDYQTRYVECPPEKLLPLIENVSEIRFPKEIKEVKTAKSIRPTEGEYDFLVKFSAEPNVVEEFTNTFRLGDEKITLGPYDKNEDSRKKWAYFPPKWFKTPIKEGKHTGILIDCHGGSLFIDTSDPKNYIVYLSGFHPLDRRHSK
jgi:hypothetical protein